MQQQYQKSHLARLAVVAVLALSGFQVQADDDDDRSFFSRWGVSSSHGVAPVENELYREECGSCHLAYSAGLLPPQSWEMLMSGLDDHFGESAELPADDRSQILNYLLNNAAGRTDYRLSNKMIRNAGAAPLRITELPYFRHEHREIPRRMIKDNPAVGSLSQCSACHRGAEKGRFDEHSVSIPGYGRYED
jgi:hypothetical protein